ncbi:hypothetical protein NAT51_00075 [Flavobacterium amniphilum]|uniref:hypothetical protein n=1 Tax=Flavobacterium amniphilum TaxID=1834035 RepID=UPI002029FDF1|nr:hypothetical protein [Flavobacterium amniphilum]MCL9803899.1 hypothetical protein [Flavobacterium amniphilum]
MQIRNLSERIENHEYSFKNADIYLKEYEFNLVSFNNLDNLRFENCTFHGDLIISHKTNSSLDIIFKHCSFSGEIQIFKCEFRMLNFIQIIEAGEVLIIENSLQIIHFTSEQNIKVNIPKISISAKIIHSLDFADFKSNGELYLNHMSNNDVFNFFSFRNSEFNSFSSNSVYFGTASNFENLVINKNLNFYNCILNETNFSKFKFVEKVNFEKTLFNNSTSFKECISLSKQAHLNFKNCTFKELAEFDSSNISIFNIENTVFEQNSSFQDLEVDSIRISKSTFTKPAFFDNIKINSIINVKPKEIVFKQSDWTRTLRIIKQELQKTENKIDFNKFRAYELAAHYKELNWKDHFTDKSILWATKWSTDFGNDWRRAFIFTIGGGLAIYTIFYASEIFLSGDYKYYLANYPSFCNGLFRFFLVTDFYNPLIEDRTYLQNSWSWFIFIIGKIFIAFGIYEMIQAFRKFKP